MKNKKKILVILGGNSRERKISLETGKSCILALNKIGFQTIKFDPKKNSLSNIKKISPDVILMPFMEKMVKMEISKVFLSI